MSSSSHRLGSGSVSKHERFSLVFWVAFIFHVGWSFAFPTDRVAFGVVDLGCILRNYFLVGLGVGSTGVPQTKIDAASVFLTFQKWFN